MSKLGRREFVRVVGGGLIATAWAGRLLSRENGASGSDELVVLSHHGSGRATAYAEASKIVTLGDRTHVVWLDAEQAGFRVRGRTLNRVTGEWSGVVTIGEARDNHGGPCLTADPEGFLHVVYYPHHRPFRYRRSLRPNDLSEWGQEIQFGESLSYPVMLCAPDGTLLLTARRYHEANDRHNEMELWRKTLGAEWERQRVIMRSRHLNYVQFAESLAWGADGRTIHLACRVHETNPRKGGAPIQTLGYLVSPDGGVTWTKRDGTAVGLPAAADTMEVLLRGGDETGLTLTGGAMAVDARGVPHLVHSVQDGDRARSYLATPAGHGSWLRRDLHDYLPERLKGHALVMPGGITFSGSGRATIVATLAQPRAGESPWAHRSSEVVRFWSDDGTKSFRSEVLQPEQEQGPHWLPNIERPTGHHAIPPEPGIIYTAGAGGAGLHDMELNNQVWWQPSLRAKRH